MQFQEDPPPQGLSEARRGSEVFTNMFIDTNPPQGASLFGAAQVIALMGLALTEISGILQFSGKILTIFFSTLFLGYGPHNVSDPAAVSIPSGAIIPEMVLHHNRKVQGRFGG